MLNISELFKKEAIILKNISESDTWCGGDCDSELDHYIALFPLDEKVTFYYEYKNMLNHCYDRNYDVAFLKLGYIDKNGKPLAASLLYDVDDQNKTIKRTILYGYLDIKHEVPSGVGTFEVDGKIYSGNFKDGKLHGFGVVFERVEGEVRVIEAGLYENGVLGCATVDAIHRVSHINNYLSSTDTFVRKFKTAIMDVANECDVDPKTLTEKDK